MSADLHSGRPQFTPDVPEPLLTSLPNTPEGRAQRWMFEQQSIQRQQNDAIMERLERGDVKFQQWESAQTALAQRVRASEERIDGYDALKQRLTGKWTVLAAICSCFLGPVALAWVGAWFYHFWENK